MYILLISSTILILFHPGYSEIERTLRVSESVPPGTHVGFVAGTLPVNIEHQNFDIIFPDPNSKGEKLFSVNVNTGEITTDGPLDYETEPKFVLLAIPSNGSTTIRVVIELEDENDNPPKFSVGKINLEVSEYARIGLELPLPVAVDPDSAKYSVKKYRIVGGNVNNVFRISNRHRNDILYADLIVNGQLDREYRDHYNLLVEAVDGGDPPKIGKLDIFVNILDANDNPPVFSQHRYMARVASNVTVGSKIVTVVAKDADAGKNAQVSYRIVKLPDGSSSKFGIDETTGVVKVVETLTAETTYELTVLASDHGTPQPLESTAFLTIHVENVATASATGVNVVWLTDDGLPSLWENLTLGYVVARASVETINGGNLTLLGTDALCLKQTDKSNVYLVLVCRPLDRERQSEYRLQFLLQGEGSETLIDHPLHVELLDINDNAPVWNQSQFHILFNRTHSLSPRNVHRFIAKDYDSGENARIHYSLSDTNLFEIDSETGVLRATKDLPCINGSEIRFKVIATDYGAPPLSSTADVVVDVIEAYRKPPIFSKALYEITVREDAEIGTCLLQVSAFDNVCGQLINRVRYSLNESPSAEFFKIEETSGRICLSKSVDFERISRHQLTVYAHNTAGKSKALINVILEDVNDNVPVFNPISYNLTLFDEVPSVTLVLTVHAEDADSGQLGKIQYILENDVDKLFRVDPSTGNLYTNRPSENFVKNSYHVIVSAKDSGGLTSTKPAQIFVDMHPKNQDCPRFTQFIYEFNVSEDILPNIVIGTVEATGSSDIRYYIHDKEARNDFRIDERLGKISVTHDLDADKRDFILLNLEARSYSGCSGFAQAKILIRDLNDNSPVFDFTNVETTLLEDFPIHEPFFAVQATDRDKHENGKVTYELISSEPPCPVMIRPLTGQLLLAASLDYEKVQKYRLRIRAIDQGLPPRMNETIVTILVQDVNDNAPELVNAPAFHNIEVSENAPLMSEVIQLKATDKDSGENGIVQFRIVEDNVPEFEIEPTSGQIFVKQNLDRETTPEYTFTVMAYDLGMPQLYANASIHIRVLDVNDNTPNCSTITPITISEDMEPFEIVGLLNAYDPDSSENGTVIYRLQQTHEFFELKRSGELRLKKRIPTDALRRLYHLSVIAEDQGAKPRSTVCQVVVKYEESRSLVQIIEPLQRVLRIAPDIAKGTEIVHIEAMNANNWTIGDRNDISKYFVIQDGSLKTNSSIDPDSFQKPQPLTVKVFDSAGHSRHVTFMIRLNYKSSGDHSMQTVKLSEDTAIGTPILNFSGPKKANFEQYFTLNYSSGLFEIDESSGTIYLAGHLDYKNRSEHVLKIVNVNLHTKEENITTVIVEVERSNKRLPLFTSMSYRFSVSEDTPIGASIGRVEFEEVYDELSISFKLNDKTSTFNIDSDTGEIYVQKSLNYNSASAYLLAVEAQESASKEKLSRHCLVHIDIVDINNNIPMFISPSNITLSHSERVGDPFHYFFAMDQDSGKFGTVSYSILSGNEQDLFEMNSTTGGLSLKKRLKDSIRLTIRASDGDTIPKFSDQLFNIFIDYGSSSSLWKYFEKDHYAFTLNADTPIGSLVHNFKRLNEPMVTFVLLPETQGEFQMDNNNGLLKTATKLTNKDYKLIVYVHTFDGNSSDFTTIDIQVKNFHTKGPKIVASSCGNVTVRENLAKDNLMRIFAIVDDADEDFPITYHIEGGSDHDLFSINASTGVISCKELDRETKPEHFLIISVSDNSIPKKADVCTIRVKVKDENDNVPIIRAASDVLEINDYTHVGAVLMKFTASDLDEGDNGRIKFMLVDDKSHLLDLKPESGELIFARDLPFTEKEWIIVISAMDSGKGRVLSSEKRIRILYKRRHIQTNNGAPEFLRHKYVAFVQESLPRGQLVAHIQTTYGSTREAPLTYSIVGGNFDSAFEIDGNGRISTAQELDAEIESEYKLRVIATGSPLKTPETTVEVKVLNINDNPPSFPVVRTRKISETLRPGSLITTVMANDVDADTQLEYRLNPANDYFEIEHLTGTIYLTKPLDFEVEPRFTLGIQAFDGIHFANLNLTFDVQDANDNAPMLKSLIEITVSPLTRPNSQIGKIIATDPDQGRAGEVFYELLTGKNLIRVERTTGIVTLLNMPFESTTHFATIKASDSGTPPLSTISTILLKPASKSVDDSPKFEKSFYTFVVSENFALHQTFGVLSTVNRTNELDYQYMIHDFKSEKQFSINRFGELSLKSPLDRETSREYRFQVNLTSLSHEFEPRSATVLVQISDINDNSPKIDPETSMKEIRLEERMKKGTILGRLFATDPDNAENGRIKYSIIAGNEPSLIQVNSNTGVVQFEHWDDSMLFESIEEIVKKNVTFLIEDEGLPPNWISYNVPLIFDTSTWSGSAPMFPIPVYHRYVLESLPKNAIILQVQAANRWGRQSSNWKYSISNHDEIFGIRVKSGEIVLLSEFDYEKRMSYEFKVQVTDLAQRSAVVSVHIHVIGVDEFAPIFTKETFRFQVPISARVGQRVGTIRATDADAGVDGQIHYAIQEPGVRLVGIDPQTGVLVVRESLTLKNNTVERFSVIASSGPTKQSTAKVYLEITDQITTMSMDMITQPFYNSFIFILIVVSLGLIALILTILAIITLRYRLCCYFKRKPQKQIYSVARGNVAVMADINRMSPRFPKIPMRVTSVNQEPSSKSSSLASSSSSENTSVPLRSNFTDIYGNRSQPDSGIDPDVLSISSSVTDYLMQIGVTPTKLDRPAIMPRRQSVAADNMDSEFNELIYARIEEILGPGPIGYYNPSSPSTSLLPLTPKEPKPPSFQPLTEVFAQISRLKEEKQRKEQTA